MECHGRFPPRPCTALQSETFECIDARENQAALPKSRDQHINDPCTMVGGECCLGGNISRGPHVVRDKWRQAEMVQCKSMMLVAGVRSPGIVLKRGGIDMDLLTQPGHQFGWQEAIFLPTQAGIPEQGNMNGETDPVFRAATRADKIMVRRREKIVPNQFIRFGRNPEQGLA